MFKTAAIVMALSALHLSALAMAPVDDGDLSLVHGQDGVTIGGDLNINIETFTWGPSVQGNTGTTAPPVTPPQADQPVAQPVSPVLAVLQRRIKYLQRLHTGQTASPNPQAGLGWRPALFRAINARRSGG